MINTEEVERIDISAGPGQEPMLKNYEHHDLVRRGIYPELHFGRVTFFDVRGRMLRKLGRTMGVDVIELIHFDKKSTKTQVFLIRVKIGISDDVFEGVYNTRARKGVLWRVTSKNVEK